MYIFRSGKRSRREALGASAVALVLALSACTSGSSGSGQANSNAGANQATISGGTLRVVSETDIDSLDPQKVTAQQDAMVMNHIYDTLIALNYKQNKFYPLLAKSWKESKDGLTYTFQLRKDVTFHSGKPFVAKDVVATLERLGSPWSTSRYYVAAVKEITAKNKYTVEIRLNHPDRWLLFNLAHPFASILNSKRIQQYGKNYGASAKQVDGTGPFKLVSWQPKNQEVMVKYPKYKWGPSFLHNPGPAHIDKIIWKEVPETTSQIQAVQTGSADMTAPAGGALNTYIDQLKSASTAHVVQVPTHNIEWLGYKVTKHVTSDVRVRQALSYAINKKALVQGALNGQGTPAHGYLDSTMPFYWQELNTKWYHYDPAKAKNLLEAAGWKMGSDGIREKNGQKLVLQAYAGLSSKAGLTLIQQNWKAIGAKMVQHLVDRTSLYAIRRTQKPDINYGYVSYTNASGVLDFYFSSQNLPSPNRWNFDNARVDADFKKAGASVTDAEAKKYYFDAQKVIHKLAPAIPLYHTKTPVFVNNKVKDFRPYPLYGITLYKSTDIQLG